MVENEQYGAFARRPRVFEPLTASGYVRGESSGASVPGRNVQNASDSRRSSAASGGTRSARTARDCPLSAAGARARPRGRIASSSCPSEPSSAKAQLIDGRTPTQAAPLPPRLRVRLVPQTLLVDPRIQREPCRRSRLAPLDGPGAEVVALAASSDPAKPGRHPRRRVSRARLVPHTLPGDRRGFAEQTWKSRGARACLASLSQWSRTSPLVVAMMASGLLWASSNSSDTPRSADASGPSSSKSFAALEVGAAGSLAESGAPCNPGGRVSASRRVRAPLPQLSRTCVSPAR